MPEHARPGHRRHPPTPFFREPGHDLGDEALEFTRWFAKSKYHLMGAFLGELTETAPRDAQRLRERYCRAVTHAYRFHQARAVVTFLLALGVIAAAATGIANIFDADADASVGILERAAAVSASISVVLVAARLLLDRYLERCDVAATFLAIQLSVASMRSA